MSWKGLFEKRTAAEKTPLVRHVRMRWMVRRDLPEVLRLERCAFTWPWDEEDFMFWGRRRNCVMEIAEDEAGNIAGYFVYEFCRRVIRVVNFAVARKYRRRGVGRQMAAAIIWKLQPQDRKRIVLAVREGNLPAQLFWRAMGFKCFDIQEQAYEDSSEPAYHFQFRLKKAGDDAANCRGK